jgi:hypothetical protein
MLYRYAAACAAVVEVMLAAHLVSIPVLHEGGPLAVLGTCFLVAFFIDETGAGISHLADWLRRVFHRWWK